MARRRRLTQFSQTRRRTSGSEAWTPEFREALEAFLSGAPDDVVAELDARAIAAAEELRSIPRELTRIDQLALALVVSIDARDWRSTREVALQLRDQLDELRDELRRSDLSDVGDIIDTTDQRGLLRRPEPRARLLDSGAITQVGHSTEGADPSSSSDQERTTTGRTARVHVPDPELGA